jgi:hypothetical protein
MDSIQQSTKGEMKFHDFSHITALIAGQPSRKVRTAPNAIAVSHMRSKISEG